MSSTLQSIKDSIPSLGRARILIKSADDVVIVSACRTAVTKVSPLDPLSFPVKTLLIRHRHREVATKLTESRPKKVDLKMLYPKTFSLLCSKRY